MASIISALTFPCSSSNSSSSSRNSGLPSPTFSAVSYHKTPVFCLSSWVSPLSLSPFSPWSRLKHLEKRRRKGNAVYASLFGVGAPEALVIVVVGLLVFGPKGLAEVARNLGKTLKAFQPTIKELQEVSREFKSSLEREIGLDEISSSMDNTFRSSRRSPTSSASSTARSVADPNGTAPSNRAYSSEEYLQRTEEQLNASAAQQQLQPTLQEEGQPEMRSQGDIEGAASSDQK